MLVGIQSVAALYLALSGPIKPDHWWIALGPVAGVLLGAWAVLEMRRSRLSILPEVRTGAVLVTTGPDRFVRHPMYASLLLILAPLTVNRPTPARWAALGVLGLALLIKMVREERSLQTRFPEYGDYAGRTRRIVPWLL